MSTTKPPGTLSLYLGYDGSYVLSPLKFHRAAGESGDFLNTTKKCSIVDLNNGDILFKPLKLAKYEIAKLVIAVMGREVL